MYFRVKSVQPLDNYLLRLTFADNEEKIFDMSSYLDHGLFAELRNESMFRSVRVSFDSIEWANGVDICPEVLYEESVPVTASSNTL
jgi:hypothetical protein